MNTPFSFRFDEDAPLRLDVYVSACLPEISRSRVKSLIDDGLVRVNGKVEKAGFRLSKGDLVEGEIPPVKAVSIEPQEVAFEIVYEDPDLAVINKPRGLVVHPAPGHESETLVNGLMKAFEGSLSGINGEFRPGIVHRIDKDTSGLLIVCKSDRAHSAISAMLKDHLIRRTYQGVVLGSLKEEKGTVDAPIGRMKEDRKKMTIRHDGRRAVTHYEVLEAYPGYSLVEFELETGRTHQIRVHMKSLHHPLLGDPLYGSEKEMGPKAKKLQALGIFPGQILHAKRLSFLHPVLEREMTFETPLPPYFEEVLSVLGAEG